MPRSPTTPSLPLLITILTTLIATALAQQISTVTTLTLPASITSTVLAASSTPSLSPQYTDSTQFQSSLLNSTNYYRYLYSAPYLQFNTSLASYAQAYSEKCIWQHNPDLSNSRLGENLARGYPTVTGSVDAWGNESLLFDYGDLSGGMPTGEGGYTGFSEATGHFTQLVWYDTQSVGCGWSDCNGKNGLDGVLLVCNYWPAGNVLGPDDAPNGGKNEFFVLDVKTERSGGADGFDAQGASEGKGGPSRTANAGSSATAGGGGSVSSSGAAGTGRSVGGEFGGGVWGIVGGVLVAFGLGVMVL